MHKTDLDIANNASKKHIREIAASINIPEDALIVYGHNLTWEKGVNHSYFQKFLEMAGILLNSKLLFM